MKNREANYLQSHACRIMNEHAALARNSKGQGRLIGYARVSTREQKLDLQMDYLQTMKCNRIFADHGVSGARAKRPELDAMLEYVQPDDTVIVWKLDRLGRSASHLANLLARFDEQGIHFVSISEGINTTTAGGKLVFHVFAAVAEFLREIIIENTNAGLDAARERGQKLGRPLAITIEDAAHAHKQILQFGTRREDIAARLGISRMTLDRTLRRYGLDEVT